MHCQLSSSFLRTIIRAVKETIAKPSFKRSHTGIINWRWPLNRHILKVGPKCGRNWPRGHDLSLYYKLVFTTTMTRNMIWNMIVCGFSEELHAETTNFTVLYKSHSVWREKFSYGRLWLDCKHSLIFLWKANARESPKHASRNKWGHTKKPAEKRSTVSNPSLIWACVMFCFMICERNWTCLAYFCVKRIGHSLIVIYATRWPFDRVKLQYN